jgi:uncharacterized membrane protein SpoIIM required for sporulation
MDYARFVSQRQATWDEFERRLFRARDGGSVGHDELEGLAFQYRQILHDHALASARFTGTGAARRLHRLSLAGTHFLQWERGPAGFSLVRYLRRDFPEAFRSVLPSTLAALGVFLVSALFGLSLALARPGVGANLLGPEAVDGLREGRLWTEKLFSVVPPALASSGIARNNMAVALTSWAGGSLAGVGSLYVLLMNGFLLGALFGVTAHYGLALRLLEFVAAHGPLEITLILVASGAGLHVGLAAVSAGDRPRREVLGEAARASLLLVLGCLPWFLLLAAVEGFVSPSTLPMGLKAGLGAALWLAFLAVASARPAGARA